MNLHPDKFQTASDVEKEYSEAASTLVNEAYATLKSPLSRAEYMLVLAGCDALAEDLSEMQLDEQFLFEIMEVREEIEMTTDSQTLEKIKAKFEQRVEVLVQQDLANAFERGNTAEALDLVVTLRYFMRIVDELKEKLANA